MVLAGSNQQMDLGPFKFYPHEILFEVIWEPWYIPYQGYISYTFKPKIKKKKISQIWELSADNLPTFSIQCDFV